MSNQTIQDSAATLEEIPLLTDAQVDSFKKLGFLALDRITTDEDVAFIRQTLERLFAEKAGHDQGAYFNFAGQEGDKKAHIPQIMNPFNFALELKKSLFRKNAFMLAKQLLGPDVLFHVDHTLLKPAKDGVPTPMHQDEAFKDPKFDYQEISFWMPLQPVDQTNGCMEFVPGSHLRGIMPHRTPGDDPRVHALECYEGFDPADVVPCPLAAGGCTLHTGRTIHGAGPNRSDAPRYAYVLIFSLKEELTKTPKSFPWQKNKATDRMNRQQEWLKNGGKFVKMWRNIRDRDYQRSFRRIKRRITSKFSSSSTPEE